MLPGPRCRHHRATTAPGRWRQGEALPHDVPTDGQWPNLQAPGRRATRRPPTVRRASRYTSAVAITPRPPRADLPAPLRDRLNNARDALLGVHKVLLDEERIRYERAHGRLESNYQLLQLVISDPWFAWLHPVSELVVQIDVLMEARQPAPPGTADALLRQARELLNPEDRKSTRLNSSHSQISYAVFCLKKKRTQRRSVRS